MFYLLDMFFHEEVPQNIWVSVVLEISYVFVILILPDFFFEAVFSVSLFCLQSWTWMVMKKTYKV